MEITQLIEPGLLCLDLKAKNKDDVLKELVDKLDQAGKLIDKEQFLADVWQREQIETTGFEDGIAIPHAKSRAVFEPAVVIGISRTGIDYDAEDGNLSNVFFMLASPVQDDQHHIEVLAQLSTKLVQSGFVDKMLAAKSEKELYQLFTTKKREPVYTLQDYTQTPSSERLSGWKLRMAQGREHLLFGTSHMIPFVVAGGVLLALSIMLSGQGAVPPTGILADIATMGIAGLTLFTAILGGYIAYSIADKPGLAPGMIGAWISVTQYHTGFLGAILVGFLAGYTVKALKKIPIPEGMHSLGSIFLYPLLGTFITCGAVMWLIGDPIALAMNGLNETLAGMANSGKVALGALLGAMTAFDMGGPVNKVATLFAQTQVNTQPWLMGGVGIAICTPPLGLALATWLSPKKFKPEEREAGKAAGLMGMIGISEGAIPFAAADPARVLPAIVAGGVVGNVVGFMFQVLNHAPWGGWIVLPVVDGKLGYIVGTLAGALTTALIVLSLKRVIEEESDAAINAYHSVEQEGCAEVLAVTSCPSGVAHTFLAAKSLEKAAYTMGIKIKVETQGANGITNRITAKDVQNAKFVIFAHDVAIEAPERFLTLKVVDVSTKDAIINAVELLHTGR